MFNPTGLLSQSIVDTTLRQDFIILKEKGERRNALFVNFFLELD
jgi:hypothetical protein